MNRVMNMEMTEENKNGSVDWYGEKKEWKSGVRDEYRKEKRQWK